jgi:hypothetical protein
MKKITFEFENNNPTNHQWSVYVVSKGWFGKEHRELLRVTKEDTLAERNCLKLVEYKYNPKCLVHHYLPSEKECYEIVKQYLDKMYNVRIRSVG